MRTVDLAGNAHAPATADRLVWTLAGTKALVEAHGRLDEAIEAVQGLDPDAATSAAQA